MGIGELIRSDVKSVRKANMKKKHIVGKINKLVDSTSLFLFLTYSYENTK